jgi:phosphatidylserine decarboxylase
MAIARQAWLPIAAAGIVSGLAYVLCDLDCSLPLVIITLVLVFLFRDPERRIPPVPLGIVSPVDGRVTAIAEVGDPFLGRRALRLTIGMKPLGPWIVRSAMEGRVMQIWHLPTGLEPHSLDRMEQNALAAYPDAGQAHFAIWVQSDEQDDVVVALRGLFISGRLRCGLQTGDRIGQGGRYGLLWFFATADVYLPAISRLEASQGGTVRAGSDIIATLVHKAKPTAAPLAG